MSYTSWIEHEIECLEGLIFHLQNSAVPVKGITQDELSLVIKHYEELREAALARLDRAKLKTFP